MVGVVAGFALAAGLTWLLVRLGPRLGYVDRPDDPSLKAHTQPAVPLGGVAIFSGVHFGLLLEDGFDLRLLVASGLLLVLGLVDDRIGLSPIVRLVVTAGAGVVLATGAESVGAGALLLVLVVVAVNAVNLYDGLDGLAGSAGALAAVAIAGLAALRGGDGLPALVVAGALAGFLVLNWHPAKAFLGDNGAYVLALLLVWALEDAGGTAIELVAGVGLLGVFLVDLLVTVLRRKRAGAPLFLGDRSHIYDRLHQSGMSVPSVAAASSLSQAALGGCVLLFVWLLPTGWAAVSIALLGLAVVAVLTFGDFLPDAADGESG